MADTMSHRGPDDSGIFLKDSLGMGFKRLSIIDLEGGNQPLFSEDRRVVVVMNGELYNFRELRSQLQESGHSFRTGSDAEVLVHLYEEKGPDLVHDLVGMFSFSILDLREERPVVILGRDRVGIKPLYYAESEDGLAWASEAKAILSLGLTSRELRPQALLSYLIRGCVGEEDSAWQGIRRLPPAHLLMWRQGSSLRSWRYWDLPTDRIRDPAAAEEILDSLDQAVGDRLVADVPLGAFLSGGIDSNAVVASMARATRGSMVACTVGFHERSHNELVAAQETSSELGLTHYSEILDADPSIAVKDLPWYFDEPHADPSNVPTFLVSQMAREHVVVALSGDGGDETFAGYRRYVHDVAENRVRDRLGSRGRKVISALGSGFPQLDWAPRVFRGRTFLRNVGSDPARAYWRSVTQMDREDAVDLLNHDLAHSLEPYDPFFGFEEHYRRPEVNDPLYRAQYADFHTYLPDLILTKVDRASMANSLEVRVPILDHRFCGRFANLPVREKVRGGRGKYAFREALRSRLRAAVLDGRKRGFDMPLRGWINGPLQESVIESIESLPDEWFRPKALQARMTEHRSGRRDHSRLLWSLLVLEHWRRCHQVRGIAAQ